MSPFQDFFFGKNINDRAEIYPPDQSISAALFLLPRKFFREIPHALKH
jgi:hypothetical protein